MEQSKQHYSVHPILGKLDREEFEHLMDIIHDPVVQKVISFQTNEVQNSILNLDPDAADFKQKYHVHKLLFQHMNNLSYLPLLFTADTDIQTPTDEIGV